MDMDKKPLGTETRTPRTDEITLPADETPVQPMTVKEKKYYQSKRFVLWRTVVILLLIAATALVVAGWFYTQDLYSQLNKKEAEIAELQSNKTATNKDDAEPVNEELTPEDQAKLAASAYYCGIVDFGCDKVDTKVLASVPYSATAAGYFVIRADTATKTQIIYLKSVDGLNWAIIYVGGGPMDENTQLKFDVPESIYKVKVN